MANGTPPNCDDMTTVVPPSPPTIHRMSILALCHPSNVDVIVQNNQNQAGVSTPSETLSLEDCKSSGERDDACGKPFPDPVRDVDVEPEMPAAPSSPTWKFWKQMGVVRFGKKPLTVETASLSDGSSLATSSASSKVSLSPSSSTGASANSRRSRNTRVLDADTDNDASGTPSSTTSSGCGKRCMATSNVRAAMVTSSYDFSAFSTVRPPRPHPGKPRPERTPAVPCTRIPHTPGYLVRSHWAPKIDDCDVALEFAVPGACKRTLGVGIEDLIVYQGQCIVGAQEPIPSVLLGGKTGKVVITVKLKGNAPSQKYEMTIQCECGTPISRGGLGAKLASAYMDYLGPDRVMPVRLKSLYTEDNGATWKAQHATVTNLGYDYERGLRLPTSGMITKIKWT